ncbi:MAG: DUF6261 family protein [Bacteroidia bacterium]
MILSKIKDYRNKESIQYLKDTVTIYKAFDLTALKLKVFVDQLEARNALLEQLFEIAKKSEKTETLESLDKRRDLAIVGIRKVADGYENYFEDDKAQAGKLITTHIDKYGSKIYILNLLAETTAINSVVNDLETEVVVKAAVTLLNLTAWVAELKQANIDFNNMYLARNTDIANQPDQNLKDARVETYPVFDLLMEKTSSFYSAFETEDYKTIMNQMDALTLKYNASIPKPTPKTKTPPVV